MANSQYNGLFMRSSIGATNVIPKPGAQSSSPDIIPYGTTASTNPQADFGGSNYGKTFNSNLTVGQPNFIYLRNKNYASDTITDAPSKLFFTKSTTLSYPSDWTEIESSGDSSFTVDSGAVGVSKDAFVWKPDDPGSNWHYCLIGMVKSPNATNPFDILDVTDVGDLASIVSQNGGVSWHNVSVVDNGQLNLSQPVSYNQGPTGGQMQISLICSGVPAGKGVKVGLSTGASGADLNIPMQEVTVDGQIFGKVATVPDDWSATVYKNWEAPPGTNLQGAKLILQVGYPSTAGMEQFMYAYTPAELGIPTADQARMAIQRQLWYQGKKDMKLNLDHQMYLEHLIEFYASVGPTRLTIVGGHTTQWS